MFDGFQPQPITEFGGKYSIANSPIEVPLGKAIDCQDVDFLPGRVFSRPGLTSVATLVTPGPQAIGNVVSLKEFVDVVGNRRLLAFTDTGWLMYEISNWSFTYPFASPTVVPIAEAAITTNLQMVSTTLFGREFITTAYLGSQAATVPIYYDGYVIRPVAACGPGDAPTVVDSATAGSISAGTHYSRVFYRRPYGAWTSLGPAGSWLAAGSKSVDVSAIPIGPTGTIARVICFTPFSSTDYYFIEGTTMVLNDNTSTTVTCNFSDATLIAGTPASSGLNVDEDLLALQVLPPQAGVVAYRDRLAWWGERNAYVAQGDLGMRNLTFDGGYLPATPNTPSGWTQRVAGGALTTDADYTSYFSITGAGGIQKGVIQNNGNPTEVIDDDTQVNIRMRMLKSSGAAAGTICAWFTTSGTNVPDMNQFSVDVSSLSDTEWRIIDGTIWTRTINGVMRSTMKLRIGSGNGIGQGNCITNGQYVLIDYIELYPAVTPYRKSLMRWSKSAEPESYDDLQGEMLVGPDDGQNINAAFVLRDSLYIMKDRSIYSTSDTGEEPNTWKVANVSTTIGCPGPRAVFSGDSWVVFISRGGLMSFSGYQPVSLTVEFQTDWNRINWNYAFKSWLIVDVEQKRIYVGVPLDDATAISHIFYGKYYTDVPSDPKSISWTTWVGPSHCAAWSERLDKTRVLVEGRNTGVVAKRDASVHLDISATISSYYKTAFVGEPTGRKLFGYTTISVSGSGQTNIDAYYPDNVTKMPEPLAVIEQNLFNLDIETGAQFSAERMAYKISSSGSGAWFSLNSIVPYVKTHPWTPLRGNRGQ